MQVITTPASHDVDTLGRLIDQIAELTKQAEAIKSAIKSDASLGGPRVITGAEYVAVYSETNRTNVDWKAVAKELNIPAELIARHSKTSAIYSVKTESINQK